MEDNKFGTVFIGGSETIGVLPENAVAWLDHFIGANEHFLIGDCSGVDLAFQNYLNSLGYGEVSVYYSGERCRFNVGSWQEEKAEKLNALIEKCDSAFFVWDGKTEEIKDGITAARKRGIPIYLYNVPKKRIRVVRARTTQDPDTIQIQNKSI